MIHQFSGELIAALLLGLGIDYWTGWSPWGLFVVGGLGFGGAMYHLIHAAQASTPPRRKSGGNPETDRPERK